MVWLRKAFNAGTAEYMKTPSAPATALKQLGLRPPVSVLSNAKLWRNARSPTGNLTPCPIAGLHERRRG